MIRFRWFDSPRRRRRHGFRRRDRVCRAGLAQPKPAMGAARPQAPSTRSSRDRQRRRFRRHGRDDAVGAQGVRQGPVDADLDVSSPSGIPTTRCRVGPGPAGRLAKKKKAYAEARPRSPAAFKPSGWRGVRKPVMTAKPINRCRHREGRPGRRGVETYAAVAKCRRCSATPSPVRCRCRSGRPFHGAKVDGANATLKSGRRR